MTTYYEPNAEEEETAGCQTKAMATAVPIIRIPKTVYDEVVAKETRKKKAQNSKKPRRPCIKCKNTTWVSSTHDGLSGTCVNNDVRNNTTIISVSLNSRSCAHCGYNHKRTIARRWKQIKGGAAKRDILFSIPDEHQWTITLPCAYCGTTQQPTRGLDRIDNDRGYEPDNVVPCCMTCNFMKWKMPVKKFIKQCLKIRDHNANIDISIGKRVKSHRRAGIKRKRNHRLLRKNPIPPSARNTASSTFTSPASSLLHPTRKRRKYGDCKSGAKHRGISFALDECLFSELSKRKCAYCGSYTWGGIDRVDNSQGYVPENVTSCCASCNYMKGTQEVHAFVKQCARICNRAKI